MTIQLIYQSSDQSTIQATKQPIVMIKVNVTWGKLKYVVECGDADNGAALKERVAALTGVPVDRQKLMAKGGWTGTTRTPIHAYAPACAC